MLEWLKRHAWKACKPLKGFAGSNPALSAETLRQKGSKIGQVLQYQRIVGLFLLFLVRGKSPKTDPFRRSSVTKS